MKHIGNGGSEPQGERILPLSESLKAQRAAREAVPLYKYSCGCIGFIVGDRGFAVIIETCDAHHDDPELFGGARNMLDKPYQKLVPELRDRIVKKIEEAFRKAHDYDQIINALHFKG
jgi:hypothetical protein